MAYIVDYMAHDPVGNVEGQLTCYDAEALAEAEKNGMVFIAVMSDGTRKVVKASEVSEPCSQGKDFVFVQPTYVDKRTAATVACFDALAAIVATLNRPRPTRRGREPRPSTRSRPSEPRSPRSRHWRPRNDHSRHIAQQLVKIWRGTAARLLTAASN